MKSTRWQMLAAASLLGVCLPSLPSQEEGKAVPAKKLVSAPAQGKQPTQEELKELRTKKLAKEFIKAGGWMTDYDKARAEAKKSGKLIFTYFTRSYAY